MVIKSIDYDIDRLLYLHQIHKRDRERIKFLGKFLRSYEEELIKSAVMFMYKFPELREILNEEIVEDLKNELKTYLDKIFSGNYDAGFLYYLTNLGEKFFELGFSPHHIIVLTDFIRNYLNSKIFEIIKEKESLKDAEEIDRLRAALRSLNKIIDLSLDVLISHYLDTEVKSLLSLGPIARTLIIVAKKFSWILDTAILIGLIILAGFIVFLFGKDVYHIFHGDITHGIIAALGDLLILWTILELLNSEIKFMLGGEFAVSSFVSVALAATIREALIASLEHNKPLEFKLSLGFIILILGIVYGIVKWYEIKTKNR